jgi:transposase
LAGEVDPERLAHLARGSLIKKQDQLKAALAGKLTPHHRVLLEELLQLIATLNRAIGRFDQEIAERLRSHDALISRIDEVTGLSRRSIEVLLGELGWDMSRFPDAAHAASWVGICPGHHETGGKQRETVASVRAIAGPKRCWCRRPMQRVTRRATWGSNTVGSVRDGGQRGLPLPLVTVFW